ncbi:hypothetical protein PFICI_06124 [Pestalotiopsis fici W106-1]|uniref:Heterokaryon incompatibility domain-containing protein n=1 Tax=Pestalotiopsis fici (strain W106-1 / CGMCC3.15140) TaxID=1229662 RepID=W3X6U1_PESFW|nr:uncharacterized protein PFICI_06124 [Pestalotiopsis fici W106-1]ETS81122.1 hypothetical protein PFICI_06124 [Pestalotiopsis fici W106-1]
MSATFLSPPFNYQSRIDSAWLRLLQPIEISQKRLSFRIIQLRRTAVPDYTAVSYTWGDQSPSEVIYLNGQKFNVRPNLWSCLYYLGRAQQTSPVGYLWVDAICINQSDDVEKTAQVRVMDQTYRDAAFVSIWLGLVSLPDHVTVENINNAPIKTLDTDLFDWQDSMIDVSNRSYWSRVWVIQEFLLARHIRLHCSNWSIDGDEFSDILCREAGIDHLSDDPLPKASRQARSNIDAHGALPLILGRHVDKHPDFLQPLHRLITEHRKSMCGDPRDKLSKDHVLIITLAHLTQFGPLVSSLRDQETITPRSDDLFEGLGVGSLAQRKRLLHRSSKLDYVGQFSSEQLSRILESQDELEPYEASVEPDEEAGIDAPWAGEARLRAMEAWSNTVTGTITLVIIGLVLGYFNYVKEWK